MILINCFVCQDISNIYLKKKLNNYLIGCNACVMEHLNLCHTQSIKDIAMMVSTIYLKTAMFEDPSLLWLRK